MKWPGRRLSRRSCSAWLLALLLLVAFGPFVTAITAQPASRLALTAALAERHTVDVRGYPLGTDRATYHGHRRSDKAPGQPLLAVPVYLAGRALGAESELHQRQRGNLGAWWVTFWTSYLPFVALVVLMYLAACRYAPQLHALAAALALGIGSMILPLSVNLYGASLAALTAYGGWLVLDRSDGRRSWLVAAGALAGMGVATEYETGIVLVVLTVVAISRVRRRAAWFALGAAAPLLVAALYQWAAFGRPWRTAHAYYQTPAIRRQIVGYAFGWRGIDATFFGQHGLLLTNPIVLFALFAAVLVATTTSSPAVRRHALIAIAVAVPYLVLCSVWRGTPALEEPGPRYMIPAIPFLAVPLAAAWARIWRPALLAALWGAYIAIAASVTFLLLGIGEPALHYTVRIRNRAFSPTVWSMAFGRLGIALYALTVFAAGAAFITYLRRAPQPQAAP